MRKSRFTFFAFTALSVPAVVALAASCGGSGEGGSAGGPTTSSGQGGSAGNGGSGQGGDLFVDGGNACVEGEACGDGGICAGGACCDKGQACGSACCDSGEVCSFQQCVTPGAKCIDATECPAGSYCEYALGEEGGGMPDPSCQGGVTPKTGKCLPQPPECAPGSEPGPNDPITCLAKCEYKPVVGQFQPVLKYAWGNPAAPSTQDSVMMAPVVIQLDDDTCDGVVDERDIPEIVFATFTGGKYNENGTIHAISIVNGQVVEKWTANAGAVASQNHPGRSIAAGNIDGMPGNEVVVCTTDGRARAYDATGKELWLSEPGACYMPSLADMDKDGDVEVVIESVVLDGKTGATVAKLTPTSDANVVVSDMNADGKLDIVTASRIYNGDGSLLVDSALTGSYPAVGDLDMDGIPEVVTVYRPTHELRIWHVDPSAPGGVSIVRAGIDINGNLDPNLCPAGSAGNTTGGGPPTVADFNGDGTPDVALAGGVGYAVFDGKKLMNPAVSGPETLLWIKQTQDCSSAATGSSVFDFDGDGKAEVVYADEKMMHVYAGTDGKVLYETCNTNGTLFEYPLVADVDNDGQADIVVVSNSYSGFTCADGSKTSGVRIFGDANGNWVRTRRVWNEHGYHVTNVNEDGTIPQSEEPNYKQPKLNNFRQNVQPQGEFSAPDLVASVFPQCGTPYALVARVRNIGEASVPPGVVVGFYLGDPAAGGMELPGSPVMTTKGLYSAEAEDVVLPLPSPPPGVLDGSQKLYVVVDDKAPAHAWHECRTDNNKSEGASGSCSGGPK
ncbi:FG-GAP repeat domain-containing protein [Polyangium aurulentum]|uniref:FG-GAP repeat domain-containing protein n=1 Tax=Polyangium aurulentum TaxID=2567896 RepID=UPI0010ADC3A7|nr:VCBS repeat-containing protein [Polyangium aurulentum]UQA61495.1 VCBS repeat-containing protein [Polyangium aurulentum]